MSEIVTIKFNGVTAEIKPVQDGMYDLNDIWRTFKLPEKKRPSEWKDDVKDQLLKSENLRNKRGRYGGAFATKKALFMYSAWCDYAFYDVVVDVFELVTEGKLEEAAEKASEVVVQREWLRKDHQTSTDLIREHSRNGTLKLPESYSYILLRRMLFGIEASKCKRTFCNSIAIKF